MHRSKICEVARRTYAAKQHVCATRGRFKAAYKGQMELYLRWLDKHERHPQTEEFPIGLILCSTKGMKFNAFSATLITHKAVSFRSYNPFWTKC